MKKFSILFLLLSSLFIQAQEVTEKEIKSTIEDVTVFIDGAQINRTGSIEVPAGVSFLKFTKLSPFIDAKSIQIKTKSDLYVLSVNFQKNYLTEEVKSVEISKLEVQLEKLASNIQLEKTYLSILNEELAFLQENRDIGGKNQEVTVSNLKEAAIFYANKLTEIKLKEIDHNEKLEKLNEEKAKLQKQINTFRSEKEYPSGEVWVKIETNKSQKADFELNYLVENAGWFPSYDIRAKSISEPIELVYKANVHQDTKEDWKNVKISFSSGNPGTSGTAPELKPYFLNYNSIPPIYNTKLSLVSGRVVDEDNQALPGAMIVIQGTTIGTTSDLDGNYSLSVPSGGGQLVCSFIGFEDQQKFINQPYINFQMKSSILMLEEVVVSGYSAESAMQGKAAGIVIRGASSRNNKKFETAPPLTVQVQNQTSFAFELEKPYSLKSDNKTQTVAMSILEIDAHYQYFAIPKLEKDAFLKAYITDWEKFNLMEGEANLFFEDTYVGKSVLDIRYAGDTLAISLGRDKNIQIKREMQKDYTDKQFIGNKKEVSKSWTISIKNNKQEAIDLILLDQVPVPTLDEIEFKMINNSGAIMNTESGELKWKLNLQSLETKVLDIKYILKFPKERRLILD